MHYLSRPMPAGLRAAAGILGGALITLSMAPFHLWPLALIAIAIICMSFRHLNGKQSLLQGLITGVSLFGTGVHWVYFAIADFGNSSLAIAFILTVLFVLLLAAVFALPFYLYGRHFSRTLLGQSIGFSALWVLGEWLRSWLFTGFPWLYTGYSFIDTPLAGFAPIGGIFLVSFIAVISASLLAMIILQCVAGDADLRAKAFKYSASAFLLWGLGAWGQHTQWTRELPGTINVGLMQPNIAQDKKWDPAYYDETLDTFSELSLPLWDLDWVIWPEAAIPYPYHQALPLIDQIDDFARTRGTVFITGIIYDDYDAYKYYNAIIARGAGFGDYYKQRLVPFGEYVPFEHQLRGLINFFNLPTSIIHVGPFQPNGLNANGVLVAATVCYEIVYPDLIAEISKDKDVLLTISNDAWFGKSIGPLQHFDMARMRALETGRYLIRATNNGISGFIDSNGKVLTTGGRFTRETIEGSVKRMSGNTPFMIWHSWPTILLCLCLLFLCALQQRKIAN